jgi:hypothetical protein
MIAQASLTQPRNHPMPEIVHVYVHVSFSRISSREFLSHLITCSHVAKLNGDSPDMRVYTPRTSRSARSDSSTLSVPLARSFSFWAACVARAHQPHM